MRKFLSRFIYFLFPAIVVFYIRPIYLLVGNKYQDLIAGKEVYLSIRKSKAPSNSSILLLGDSVGKQLFDNRRNYDSINSLACNQGIEVIGQYFLLNNYLKAGNKPEAVFLIYNPFSFCNNLDQVYTFQYFLKPFFHREYKGLFTNEALRRVQAMPYPFLSQEPYILTSNWAPVNKFDLDRDYNFLSPISREYLENIKVLCLDHGISFHILPPPTKESNREKVSSLNKKEISGTSIQVELNDYLNSIYYLPDSLFLDNVHLKNPEQFVSRTLDLMNRASGSEK